MSLLLRNNYNTSTTDSVYNMAESKDSSHLTKTLKNMFVPPRLSSATVSATTYNAPQTCPQPQTCCPFVPQTFTKLTQILVLPHTCLQHTYVSILPQNILEPPTLGFFSSILVVMPQSCLALDLFPNLLLIFFPSLVVHHCSL